MQCDGVGRRTLSERSVSVMCEARSAAEADDVDDGVITFTLDASSTAAGVEPSSLSVDVRRRPSSAARPAVTDQICSQCEFTIGFNPNFGAGDLKETGYRQSFRFK